MAKHGQSGKGEGETKSWGTGWPLGKTVADEGVTVRVGWGLLDEVKIEGRWIYFREEDGKDSNHQLREVE